jgi:phosphatidylinositol alpha-mannosyltransferase
MNIALTSFYLPSVDKIGVGYQAHYMAEALRRRGHVVMMFSPAPRVDGATYEHRQVDAGRRFRLHGFAWAMRSQDLSAFDVLHSHGECHWVWSMPRGRRPRAHVRTVHGSCLEEAWHIRGLGNKVRMLYIAGTETLACATAGRVAAVSSNTCRFYPWIKRVIPNGVDLSAFRPGEKESVPTLLFVGTYQNRKRGKWLLDVFRREVRPRVPNARLWMVCSDVPADEASEGVEVLGRLTLDELGDRYRRAWAFCLPSTYEGFGVPYIEAMASGTAVVTTRNPGSVEVLENGRWGRLVADEALGAAIVAVLNDEQQRAELEALGLERARRYGWDTIAAEYEAVYREMQGAGATKVVTA